ncbi:AroM family protein [Streptomyces sp. NRRL F-5126]|uniref:AroM family protein n=1 Tax=Streptomyces sp. NRRL F-5126 TaxID=1463857 RepID=UPI00068A2313|nr:AroM family protein [Streptomyces sp. NRRL F-5126]
MTPVGLLTIGQSPRPDVEPTLAEVLGETPLVCEGALDGLTREQIAELAVPAGPAGIETRLADGSTIVVRRDALPPLLRSAAARLPPAVRLAAYLCTGALPDTGREELLLLDSGALLHGTVAAAARGRRLGVVSLPSDLADAPGSWARHDPGALYAAADPYGHGPSVAAAACELAESGAALLVLDCMGFGREHQEEAARACALPVICPAVVLAHTLAALGERTPYETEQE